MNASNEDCKQDRLNESSQVKELLEQSLKEGDTWYLIDIHWFNTWKKYVGWDPTDQSHVGDPSCHPGCIDNSGLFKDNTDELKEHLTDELDYFLVSETAWEFLQQKYSLAPGQRPIARKVVDHGMLNTYLKVEVYLTELKLAKYPDTSKYHEKKFSKKDSLETVEAAAREIFNIPKSTEVHLWSLTTNEEFEALTQKKQTIQEMSLSSNQVVVVEPQNSDGSWPRKMKTLSYKRSNTAGTSHSSYDNDSSSSSRMAQPGLCGLNNLGNTCFMNSVLQCMSNTPPIQRYFVERSYMSELNEENPLGNQGEIAIAFADLLRAMWSGNHHSFAPRAFKIQVGRFAPQFSGYQQHDSQELLTFLLDGLHEDLNRVLKKPYIVQKDSDGRPDEEVAREAWENYLKRNDSIIVDLFHGLLKSTLVCPECNKVSVTFDPTCYLSLPMAVKKDRTMEVYLVRLNQDLKPMKYRVMVPKSGIIQDLVEALSKLSGVDMDRMLVADVYQHRFHQIFSSDSQLCHISDRDTLYVYELPEKVNSPGFCNANIYFKVKAKNNYGYGNLFGLPIMLQIPREGMNCDQIYDMVVNRIRRCLKATEVDEIVTEDLETKSVARSDDPADSDDRMDIDGADEPADLENGNEDSTQTNGIDSPKTPSKKRLFIMEKVNSACSSSLDKLEPNGEPITLPAKCYIACEWEPAIKEAYFNADIAEDYEEDPSSIQKAAPKKQSLQLKECLELFTSVERLGADDAWYCPNCKKHQRATKKFDLWSLPEVLVIHLKRFSFTRSLRDKLDTLVEFPTRDLDMAPYIINPNGEKAVYNLIGVCNHYGGLGGGHYTAYAKNKDDGKWYYFDDSSVSETSESAVCSKAAYVLFYHRKNSFPSWLENIRRSKAQSSPVPVRSRVERNSVDSEKEMDSS